LNIQNRINKQQQNNKEDQSFSFSIEIMKQTIGRNLADAFVGFYKIYQAQTGQGECHSFPSVNTQIPDAHLYHAPQPRKILDSKFSRLDLWKVLLLLFIYFFLFMAFVCLCLF
jgi:hypothetical protein